MMGYSQVGKAADFDSVMRRFESCYPSQYDPLAQSAEHLTFNQGVRSSNLRWLTRKKHFFGSAFFNEINPFRICEIHFVREILLRNVKYALRRVDLFHFTENFSFLFHNLRSKLFHIEQSEIFH